jgi:hypothetical protein
MIGAVDDLHGSPLAVAVGDTQILMGRVPPPGLEVYRENAELAEDFTAIDGHGDDAYAGYCFMAISEGGAWPRLA